MFTIAGFLLVLVAAKNDAAIQPLYVTRTSKEGDDKTIPWTYDNAPDMETVDWSYKSSSLSTPTTIMSKIGAAAATVSNNFNVEHVSDGIITLKNVTLENAGIYYCTVTYTVSSTHAPVTGTVTLSVTMAPIPAPIPDINDCPVLGSSIPVDSAIECGLAWFGIFFGILLVVPFFIGIICGYISLCAKCRKEWVNYYRCECFASTQCGACCNIEGLPKWYQGLWASIIGIPVALGIWVVWKCLGKGNNDSSTNDVGTGSSPKNASTKLPEKKKVSKSPGKADNANKEKHASAKQLQHDDQAHQIHLENKGKKLPQSLPPVGANQSREGSGSVVSGRDVEMQETDTSLRGSHDRNVHHPANIVIPTRRAGALEPISSRAEV